MHMKTILRGTAALAALALAAGSASAQSAVKTTGSAKLKAAAKISDDSARAVAMATVPNATIRSAELEREHGKLIYSFDMKVAGKSGIEEVNVDAVTGKLIAHEHETPKAEKKEAMMEQKEAAKAAAKKP
jgi:uncharacterized membrane protein YkoI